MKLYITGSVGSGKSTLARRLSERLGIPCHELDDVVHGPGIKRGEEERDALFCAIIGQEHWIVEDTGRRFFEESRRRADTIVLLEPPVWLRSWRIITR